MAEDDEDLEAGSEQDDARSRTDAKRARRTREDILARVAKQLVEMSPRRLNDLELPETLLDAVRDAQAISSPPAKNRQLRVVRSALRAANWSLIRARMEALIVHGAIPASLQTESAAEHAWVARLLGEGPSAIEDLVKQCPSADRTHLRNLVRSTQKASADRRRKAEAKLADTVRSLLHRS